MAAINLSHGQLVKDAIDIEGNPQATLSLTSSAAQTAALAEGVYHVWADAVSYIKVDPTANDVTTSTGYIIRANATPVPVIVRAGSKIGGITGTTATLSYQKVA